MFLKNERDEWELSGGALEPGESPQSCVAREITEECDVEVAAGPLLDVHLHRAADMTDVLVVTHLCQPTAFTRPKVSAGHEQLALFSAKELSRINLPARYVAAIGKATMTGAAGWSSRGLARIECFILGQWMGGQGFTARAPRPPAERSEPLWELTLKPLSWTGRRLTLAAAVRRLRVTASRRQAGLAWLESSAWRLEDAAKIVAASQT